MSQLLLKKSPINSFVSVFKGSYLFLRSLGNYYFWISTPDFNQFLLNTFIPLFLFWSKITIEKSAVFLVDVTIDIKLALRSQRLRSSSANTLLALTTPPATQGGRLIKFLFSFFCFFKSILIYTEVFISLGLEPILLRQDLRLSCVAKSGKNTAFLVV